jgi:hypothetical protein
MGVDRNGWAGRMAKAFKKLDAVCMEGKRDMRVRMGLGMYGGGLNIWRDMRLILGLDFDGWARIRSKRGGI